MRFYEVDGGRITLDGVDIATMPREELRSQIGMVLQDTWLFGGTIARTSRTAPDATEEEIVEAAEGDPRRPLRPHAAGRLRHRDRRGGHNVSAGEKQLITIARAFLAEPRS
jgi:ATP-binding cassette subfamily B multidrug efflux pump